MIGLQIAATKRPTTLVSLNPTPSAPGRVPWYIKGSGHRLVGQDDDASSKQRSSPSQHPSPPPPRQSTTFRKRAGRNSGGMERILGRRVERYILQTLSLGRVFGRFMGSLVGAKLRDLGVLGYPEDSFLSRPSFFFFFFFRFFPSVCSSSFLEELGEGGRW